MFIIAVAFTSFYSVATVGTKYIIESKNRLGAVALANGKMEIIRNLAYEDVGILESADVEGNIPAEVEVTSNGRIYKVNSSVRYFDDPMDETSPADSIPNDYKIVQVVVSWKDSNGQIKEVTSVSRFVPPGLETSDGGSPLSINVIDEETLLPITQATVHITNSTPAINDTINTDNEGHIMLPAAKIADGNHLFITKAGYESIETMDTSAVFTPIYGHVNVVSGFLNTYNYFQNKLSNLTIKTVNFADAPIGGIEFSMGGGKIIGHNDLNVSIFNMPKTVSTTDGTSGEKKFTDISPGNYTIEMNTNAQFEFIDFDPSISPTYLSSNSDVTQKLRVADKNINSLLVEIKDSDIFKTPIADAKVTLADGAVEIFIDKPSSLRGIVFYPDGGQVLENKTYTMTIKADGYSDYSQDVTIDKLTTLKIELSKI